MIKRDYNKAHSHAKSSLRAQAAIELAVFGAILIFVLGSVIRSAVGNSYQQNQALKGMRMAMMASFQGSQSDANGHPKSLSRNSASILFVEDRLAPEVTKYGPLERSPEIANGSGSFSYQMLYPLDATEVGSNLPIMDVYINGQQFPFTMASYATKTFSYPPSCGSPPGPGQGPYTAYPLTTQQCQYNQCLRNAREWVTYSDPTTSPPTTQTYKLFYSQAVNGTPQFSVYPPTLAAQSHPVKDMELSGDVTLPGTNLPPGVTTNINGDMEFDLLRNGNYAAVEQQLPLCTCTNPPTGPAAGCSTYTCPVPCAATCTTCINNNCTQDSNPSDSCTPSCPKGSQYTCPVATSTMAKNCLRADMTWQWYATAGTTASLIGLDADNQQYPSYDIDGRLKTVTIYNITGWNKNDPTGAVTVSYEDPQGGDIDGSWDSNSCGPKPGLQNQFQIYTFTQNGTYFQIKEGKLYNPETGQVVRSVNQRNNVDLIQRQIQLSNNTGRFCSIPSPSQPTQACPAGSVYQGVTCASPNPVEVCVDGVNSTCFSSQQNIKSTCYDTSDNMIFVRSRLNDRRGRFWITNATGPLGIQ